MMGGISVIVMILAVLPFTPIIMLYNFLFEHGYINYLIELINELINKLV